jgi:ComF family protein
MIKIDFKKFLRDSPRYIKDIFSPKYCAGCSIEGALLCDSCRTFLPPAIEFCPGCRKIYDNGFTHKQCLVNSPLLPERITSAFAYSGAAKDIILSMKFRKESRYANLLATFCIEKIKKDKELSDFIKSAIITYVPMFWIKENIRGFNQSRLIAEDITKTFKDNSTDLTTLLKRNRYGSTQSSLLRTERLKNTENLFSVGSEVNIKDKNILLIDDVCTTGSTFCACTAALKIAGVKTVYCLAAVQD